MRETNGSCVNRLPMLVCLVLALMTVCSWAAAATPAMAFNYPLRSYSETLWYFGQSTDRGRHAGQDCTGEGGTPVYAVSSGTISYSVPIGDYGWVVTVDHALPGGDYVYSLYGHISTRLWKKTEGDVYRGQLIGFLAFNDEDGGSWGPHLHFGIRAGKARDYPSDGSDVDRWMAGYTPDDPRSHAWLNPTEFVNSRCKIPLAGDWDGDGIATFGQYNTNTCIFSLDNGVSVQFGIMGDVPILGSWAGESIPGIGVFRPLDSDSQLTKFFVDFDMDGATDKVISFGMPQHLPVIGDWTGDGCDTIGVFSPADGTFHLDNESVTSYADDAVAVADVEIQYGTSGDIPLAGDWDCDGVDDIGVMRPTPTTNEFYLDLGLTGDQHELGPYAYGDKADLPVIADWDGDGDDNIGVFRASTDSFFANPAVPPNTGPCNGDGIWYVDASVVVPGDGRSWETAFKTIQEGIDAASGRHVVLVAEGTYRETIDFKGKAIEVRSKDPLDSQLVAATVIDGDRKGSVVTFASRETSESVLTGFTITKGSAVQGGGIYCFQSAPGGGPTITRNVVTHNTADSGGGIYCNSSHPFIAHNTITDNESSFVGFGGGVCLENSSAQISYNTIEQNQGGNGGGIYCNGLSPSIAHNVIHGNRARLARGGGLYCSASLAKISDNVFEENSAGSEGGGICCVDTISAPSVDGNTFRSNSANRGGGVYCENSSPNIEGNTLTMNSADFNGGAIYCAVGADAVIANNVVDRNESHYGRGAIYCESSAPAVIENHIAYNRTSAKGGGISCKDASPTIVANTFVGNSARDNGGGLYLEQAPAVIARNTIVNNSSESRGGGICCNRSSPSITDNLFKANSAILDGGAVYCQGTSSSPEIINNTVVWNSSPGVGGIASSSSTPVIANCIVWGNGDDLSQCNATYSCIEDVGDENEGLGVIHEEPGFAGLGCQLLPTSPCVDTGANDASGLSEWDIGGRHRIMYGGKSPTVDMGAYEFHIWPPTVASETGNPTLKWSTLADKTYSIYHSSDMLTWELLEGAVASMGDTITTWTDPTPGFSTGEIRRRYYKVLENE